MMHSIDDFDRLLHTLPVGVFVYRTKKDGSAEFDYVSKRCADLVGVEAALVMQDGNSLFASLHPDDAAGFADTSARAIQFLRKYSWEGRFIVDGKIRWIHAESTPQPGGGGETAGVEARKGRLPTSAADSTGKPHRHSRPHHL